MKTQLLFSEIFSECCVKMVFHYTHRKGFGPVGLFNLFEKSHACKAAFIR